MCTQKVFLNRLFMTSFACLHVQASTNWLYYYYWITTVLYCTVLYCTVLIKKQLSAYPYNTISCTLFHGPVYCIPMFFSRLKLHQRESAKYWTWTGKMKAEWKNMRNLPVMWVDCFIQYISHISSMLYSVSLIMTMFHLYSYWIGSTKPCLGFKIKHQMVPYQEYRLA